MGVAILTCSDISYVCELNPSPSYYVESLLRIWVRGKFTDALRATTYVKNEFFTDSHRFFKDTHRFSRRYQCESFFYLCVSYSQRIKYS